MSTVPFVRSVGRTLGSVVAVYVITSLLGASSISAPAPAVETFDVGRGVIGVATDDVNAEALFLRKSKKLVFFRLDFTGSESVSLPMKATSLAVDTKRRVALLGTRKKRKALSFLDIDSRTLLPDSIDVPGGIDRIVVEPNRGLAVVLTRNRRRIDVIDVVSRSILESFKTRERFRSLAVHPTRGNLYAVVEPRRARKRKVKAPVLLVIDLELLAPEAEVPLPMGAGELVVDAALDVAAVANPTQATIDIVRLATYDVSSVSFPLRSDAASLHHARGLAVFGSRADGRVGWLDLNSMEAHPDYVEIAKPERVAVSVAFDSIVVTTRRSGLVHFVPLPSDTVPPVVTPPPDVVVEATAVLTPVTLGSAAADDDVDGSIPAVADRPGPFTLGSHVVTWRAEDRAGNVGSAEQNVVVEDTTPPVLTVASDVRVESTEPIAVELTASASDIFDVELSNDAPALFPLGTTVVTWVARDASGNESSDTQRVIVEAPGGGGDPTWGKPQLLEYETGSIWASQFSMSSDGTATAVWTQKGSAFRYDVWSRRFDPTRHWSEPQTIETSSDTASTAPDVVQLDSGDAVATWVFRTGSQEDVWANRHRATSGWDAAVSIEDLFATRIHPGTGPHVELGGNASGVVFAVWTQNGAKRLHAARHLPGAGWQAPAAIDTGERESSWPRVVVDADGRATVVYREKTVVDGRSRNDLWAQRSTGSSWRGPELLESVDRWGDDPVTRAYWHDLGVDAAGNVLSVFVLGYDNRHFLWANRYDVTSGWGTAERISESGDPVSRIGQPFLAVQDDGRAVVVWNEDGVRRVSNRYQPGVGWLGSEVVTTYPSSLDIVDPAGIATDRRGNVIVSALIRPPSAEIRAQRFSFDGGWEAYETVRTSDRGIFPWGLELDAEGNAFLFWGEAPSPTSPVDLWFSRYNASGANEPPIAYAGAPFEATIGMVNVLDGTFSSDGDGDIVDYAWRQTTGPAVALMDADEATASFIGPDVPVGTVLEFRLTVTDDAGASDTSGVTATVIVADLTAPVVTPPPDLVVEASALLTPVDLGTAVALDDVDGPLTPAADRYGPFALGVHTIVWSATDSSGNTGTAEQMLTVRDTTAPALSVPDDVTALSATPTPLDIGTAAASDLFEPVMIVNDAPAVFPLGETVVRWTATDANGNAAEDLQRIVVKSVGLTITRPADGASVQSSDVLVTGTIFGPTNTGIVVSGVPAMIDDGNFSVLVPLEAGDNDLVVTATTPAGETDSRAMTVTRTGASIFDVRVLPAAGIAPVDVELIVEPLSPFAAAAIDVDFEADGSVDVSTDDVSSPIVHSYADPGLYTAEVTVTDQIGREFRFLRPVQAVELIEAHAMFLEIWEGVTDHLAAGEIEEALAWFDPSVRDRYRASLEAMASELPALFTGFPAINPVRISDRDAEYLVLLPATGGDLAYFIYFRKSFDGVWRLFSL